MFVKQVLAWSRDYTPCHLPATPTNLDSLTITKECVIKKSSIVHVCMDFLVVDSTSLQSASTVSLVLILSTRQSNRHFGATVNGTFPKTIGGHCPPIANNDKPKFCSSPGDV